MINMESIVENVLRRFEGGVVMLRRRDEEKHAVRQISVDRGAVLVAERQATVTEHEKLLTPLRSARQAAKTRFEAADAKTLQAERVKASALHPIDAEIQWLTNERIRTADPRIDDARRAMERQYEHRRHSMGYSDRLDERDLETSSGRRYSLIGNEGARRRLMAALSTARQQFDALKLQNPADVDAAIAAIVAPVDAAWARIKELDPSGDGGLFEALFPPTAA